MGPRMHKRVHRLRQGRLGPVTAGEEAAAEPCLCLGCGKKLGPISEGLFYCAGCDDGDDA